MVPIYTTILVYFGPCLMKTNSYQWGMCARITCIPGRTKTIATTRNQVSLLSVLVSRRGPKVTLPNYKTPELQSETQKTELDEALCVAYGLLPTLVQVRPPGMLLASSARLSADVTFRT